MNLRETKKLGMNTRFVFAAPRWWVSAIAILIISLFFNFLLGGWLIGFLYFGLPAYLSALLAIPLARAMKVRYWLKTEMFLNLFQVTLFVIIFFISKFLLVIIVFIAGTSAVLVHLLISLFFISLAIPIWLRWTYLASIITTHRGKAMVLTLTYPISQILSFAILPYLFGNLPETIAYNIALYSLYTSISVLFAFIFTETMDRPLKRVLGIGGLEFTRWALEHYKERTELGKKKLEEIFRGFGKDALIDIKVLKFLRDGKIHGIVAIHTAHMGPFGEVGGSNMSEKLSRMLGCKNFLSPHGASTHEMNPTDIGEIRKMAEAMKSMESKAVKVSEPIRVDGKVKVMAQRFGDYLMIVETSHPDGTEDVDPSVAMLLEEKIKSMGYEGLIFIDAHNCSTEHADETFVHSERYREMEKSVIEAAERLKNAGLYDAKIGIGDSKALGIEYGIGPLGIISMVIEVNGHRTGYIVIDGNNMVKELRDAVMKKAGGIVDYLEIMTTDNHYVNRVYGGTNPVGKSGDIERIADECINSLKNAIGDLKGLEVLVGKDTVKLRVFGHDTPAKLVAVPESVSAMGKSLAFLNLLSMVLLDILLAILI